MKVMCTKKMIYMRLTAQCNADEQRESPGRTQNRKQMFLNCSMYKNIFTVLSISPFLTRRQAENNRSFMSFAGKMVSER